MDFLDKGDYTLTIYQDAKDTYSNPNNLIKETKVVSAKDQITLSLASDGGAAMHFQPIGN